MFLLLPLFKTSEDQFVSGCPCFHAMGIKGNFAVEFRVLVFKSVKSLNWNFFGSIFYESASASQA